MSEDLPQTEVGLDAESANGRAVQCRRPLASRLNRAFGPVVAGLIIDLVDLGTFGPIGLILGFPIGGLAGYWMASCLGLSRRACFLCAILAGLYCMVPFTEMLPLATLVGAYARFRDGEQQRADDGQEPPATAGS